MPLIFDLAVKRLRRSERFRSWSVNHRSRDMVIRTDRERRPVELNPKVSAKTDKPAAKFEEQHFAPAELAKTWGVSVQTIREIFKNEDGVLKLGSSGTRTRRAYKTLRIPQSVAERVHARLSA